MSFKLMENQTNEVKGFDDREDAISFTRRRHGQNMQRWHEVYYQYLGKWIGIAQWKPGDCPECQRPCYITHNIAEEAVYVCDPCDIEIPFPDLDNPLHSSGNSPNTTGDKT